MFCKWPSVCHPATLHIRHSTSIPMAVHGAAGVRAIGAVTSTRPTVNGNIHQSRRESLERRAPPLGVPGPPLTGAPLRHTGLAGLPEHRSTVPTGPGGHPPPTTLATTRPPVPAHRKTLPCHHLPPLYRPPHHPCSHALLRHPNSPTVHPLFPPSQPPALQLCYPLKLSVRDGQRWSSELLVDFFPKFIQLTPQPDLWRPAPSIARNSKKSRRT